MVLRYLQPPPFRAVVDRVSFAPCFYSRDDLEGLLALLKPAVGATHAMVLSWEEALVLDALAEPRTAKLLLGIFGDRPLGVAPGAVPALPKLAPEWMILADPAMPLGESGWLTPRVHRPLHDALLAALQDDDHPLAGLGIGHLPVGRALECSFEPLEFLRLLDRAIGHRLRFALPNADLEEVDVDRSLARTTRVDWLRSLSHAAAEELAARLGRIPDEALRKRARDAFAGGTKGIPRELERPLAEAGVIHQEDDVVELLPLARFVSDDWTTTLLFHEITADPAVPPPAEFASRDAESEDMFRRLRNAVAHGAATAAEIAAYAEELAKDPANAELADSLFARARRIAPADPEVLRRYAKSLVERNDPRAAELFEDSVVAATADPELLAARAQVLARELDQRDRARAFFEQAIAHGASPETRAEAAAFRWEAFGEDVRQELHRLSDEFPDSGMVWLYRASFAEAVGATDDAVHCFERAVVLGAPLAAMYYAIFRWEELGTTEGIEEPLLAAARSDKLTPIPLGELATFLACERRDLDRAAALWAEAMRRRHQSEFFTAWRCALFRQRLLGDDRLGKALLDAPITDRTAPYRSMFLWRIGRREEARDGFVKLATQRRWICARCMHAASCQLLLEPAAGEQWLTEALKLPASSIVRAETVFYQAIHRPAERPEALKELRRLLNKRARTFGADLPAHVAVLAADDPDRPLLEGIAKVLLGEGPESLLDAFVDRFPPDVEP